MAKVKVAVLISGRGSNMQALIDACEEPDYPAEIVVVVSSRRDAAGLDKARHAGLPAVALDHRDFPDRAGFEAALVAALDEHGTELICLAGFMRLLSAEFVSRWRDRLVNIHPSLLPAFRGLNAHRQALTAGVRFSGCTVHFVRPEMDAGPIIAQAAVPVHDDDDEAGLAARVLAAEHRCYPLALRLIAEGRVRVEGERVAIEEAAAPPETLLNPVAALSRRSRSR